MFETNSASCGGFPGISDSFGGALWALDYGLQVRLLALLFQDVPELNVSQMAYSNFSGAMLHVGGQNVFYNVGLSSFSTEEYLLIFVTAVYW
jgi:hypothetical protein